MREEKMFMRKTISSIIAITLFASLLKAQIPYATQQPTWYIPVYFQDATGQKDTVYFGYDPSASGNFNDVQFGERNQAIIPGQFQTAVDLDDSIVKVAIRDSAIFRYYHSIYLRNVSYPLVIKYDLSLLRNPLIPYPNSANTPEAQIIIGVGNSSAYPGPPVYGTCYGDVVIASDSIDPFCGCCTNNDSIVLYELSGNTDPKSDWLNFALPK